MLGFQNRPTLMFSSYEGKIIKNGLYQREQIPQGWERLVAKIPEVKRDNRV